MNQTTYFINAIATLLCCIVICPNKVCKKSRHKQILVATCRACHLPTQILGLRVEVVVTCQPARVAHFLASAGNLSFFSFSLTITILQPSLARTVHPANNKFPEYPPFSMDENAALQAKIAALSGQIKQHKEGTPSYTQATYHPSQYHNSSYSRGHPRWAPYNRGGRAGYPGAHRNRTLVVGGAQGGASSASVGPVVATSPEKSSKDRFVSTRGPGKNQLMTKETYNREQKQKSEQLNPQDSPQRTKRPQSAGYGVKAETVAQQNKRELVIDGIRFRMADDGSKLFRIPCEPSIPIAIRSQLKVTAPDDASTSTPKTFKIADVTFIRTKHGNLVRTKSIEGNSRYNRQINWIPGRCLQSLLGRNIPAPPKPQCEHFTKYGTSPPRPQVPVTLRLDLRLWKSHLANRYVILPID